MERIYINWFIFLVCVCFDEKKSNYKYNNYNLQAHTVYKRITNNYEIIYL